MLAFIFTQYSELGASFITSLLWHMVYDLVSVCCLCFLYCHTCKGVCSCINGVDSHLDAICFFIFVSTWLCLYGQLTMYSWYWFVYHVYFVLIDSLQDAMQLLGQCGYYRILILVLCGLQLCVPLWPSNIAGISVKCAGCKCFSFYVAVIGLGTWQALASKCNGSPYCTVLCCAF